MVNHPDSSTDALGVVMRRWPNLRILTVRQPWADLIMAGVKDVENRSWPVPSTLPQWMLCKTCGLRDRLPWNKNWSSCERDHGYRRADGPFPFRLGIHASKGEHSNEYVAASWGPAGDSVPLKLLDDAMTDPRRGVLLGTVEVTGCHHAHEHWDEDAPFPFLMDTDQGWQCSSWAEPDVWHWRIDAPVPLEDPIPMPGRLGLWTLPTKAPA